VSSIDDAPSLEPAAKTLTKRAASSAPAPNWFNDVPTVLAAEARSTRAASASLTASFCY
jgi:hypothetical protein